MNLEFAEALIAAARVEAQRQEIAVSIAVVDGGGALTSFARMDGASFLGPDIAAGKAHTAVAFARSTEDAAAMVSGRPELAEGFQRAAHGQLTFARGGLPVFAAGVCVGGIGVAGGTGEQDIAIASAATTGASAGLGTGK